jgi:hypothetical protein
VASFGSPEAEKQYGKPWIVHAYNEVMPGVDLADQKRHSRQVATNCLAHWYKKVFMYLIDVSLINAYIVAKDIFFLCSTFIYLLCHIHIYVHRYSWKGRFDTPYIPFTTNC